MMNIKIPILEIFSAGMVILAGGCNQSNCSNYIKSEIYSPNKKNRVVLFSRECGATTSSNSQATIIGRKELLRNEVGNVFVMDNGIPNVVWRDDAHLVVRIPSTSRVFKKETLVKGVKIEYSSE